MTLALTILAFLLMLAWLIGSIAPVLPWPLLSFVGLLILTYGAHADISTTFLLIMLGATIISMVTDYVLPIIGTKKWGWSKRGTRWSTCWLVLWVFILPPRGMIIFPLLGAFLGEMIIKQSFSASRKAAIWSFTGNVLSTVIKLIVAGIILRQAIIVI